MGFVSGWWGGGGGGVKLGELIISFIFRHV